MLSIRCPICGDVQFLVLADWEDFYGLLPLGEQTRLGLLCQECHTRFLLQLTLSQVV